VGRIYKPLPDSAAVCPQCWQLCEPAGTFEGLAVFECRRCRLSVSGPHAEARPHVMWRYRSWRCEYVPVTPGEGRMFVFAGGSPIIDQRCSPGAPARELAASFYALVLASQQQSQGQDASPAPPSPQAA